MLSQKLDKQKKGKEKTEKGRQTVDMLTDCYYVFPCNSLSLCSSVFSAQRRGVNSLQSLPWAASIPTYNLHIFQEPNVKQILLRIAIKQTKLQ